MGRKSKNNFIKENNIRSGFYKTSFAVQDAEKNVKNYILTKKYGETVTNLTLSSMLGFNLENEKQLSKYKRTMAKIRKDLIEESYIMKPVNGIGYYIMRPNEIPNYCYRTYIKRTMSTLDKSDLILVNTDKEKLTGEHIQEYKDIVELNNKLNDVLWNTTKNSNYYNRMEHYNSLVEEK